MGAEFDDSLLSSALKENDIEKATSLINEISLSSMETWERGFNFLCYSLNEKNFEIAKLLINHGCKLRSTKNKTTVLHVAILNANIEIIKLIHKKLWNEDETCNLLDEDEDGKNVFHVFMYRTPVNEECHEILKYLLKNCPIGVTSTVSHLSPIHYAAKYGNTEMVQLLLSIDKTQVNNVSRYLKYTPLHFAVERGHLDIIYLLLNNSAIVDAKTTNDESALCLAVKLRLKPIVHILLPYYNQKSLESNPLNEERRLIYCAVQSEEPSMLDYFLKRGLDPNNVDEKTRMTPLFLAIEKASLESVKLLINHGANLKIVKTSFDNFSNETDGYSVLHFAAKCNIVEIFLLLLENGAVINALDRKKQNPLHIATERENLAVINGILNSDCDISQLFIPDFKGMTPLHIAVYNDNKNLVKLFLRHGVSVNLKTRGQLTPLHIAARKGLLPMVELLLKFRAKPCVSGSIDLETPLFYASLSGNLEIVKILYQLCKRGSDLWLEGYVALYAASYNGHEEIIKFLLEKGADPNISYRNYLSPLHAAAQQGHESIINLLIENGAFVNQKWDQISTPFLAALSHGHENIAHKLQEEGANLNVKLQSAIFYNDSEFDSLLICGYESRLEFNEQLKIDYTPIYFAIQSGNIDLVKEFIKIGCDINVRTKLGESPLSFAVKLELNTIVSHLLESGAKIQYENSNLLFTAISLNNLSIVKLLLNKNHSVDYVGHFGNQDGFTVMHLAIKKNNPGIVNALLERDFFPDTCTEKDYLLHYAIDKRNEEIILKLIERGASLDSTCFKGLNPCLHALLAGDTKIFKLLIEKGAVLRERSIMGKNLLHFALDNLLAENVIKFLIEIGINVNEKNEFLLSLIERIIYDKREKIEILNARYSQLLINEMNDRINLELISEHWSETLNEITNENESERVCDDTFNGLIIRREYYNPERILGYLLNFGFDVNTIIELPRQTILHYTCISSNTKAVRMLLLHNPDLNVIDHRGHVAFCYAVEHSLWAWAMFHQECCSDVYEDEEEHCISPDLHWNDYDNFEKYRQRTTEIRLRKILRNRDEFKKIARFMTQALAKIEAAGQQIHNENIHFLNSVTVETYYKLCKSEIENLKRDMITGNISWFNILVGDEVTLSTYAGNESIRGNMLNDNIEDLFPLYGEELKYRFNIGCERRYLMDIAGNHFEQVIDRKSVV